MIKKCKYDDITDVFNYIDKDYGKCLYMYIDLKKYGLENENFNVWIQYDNQKICGVISKYYNGIQIYSKSNDFIINELVGFIKKNNPNMISGMKKSIQKIQKFFPEYFSEIGTVGKLIELKFPPNKDAYLASFDELDEIAKIISKDENLGKPYGYELIYKQYYERKNDQFGRNFILRDNLTNEIICHAATYAELPELCVFSGVLTTPKYRGKGFSKGTLAALSSVLLQENKEIFSYFYIPPAEKMHYGIGFEKIGDWEKLTKSI